jgi:hypothetical protein
VDVEVRIKVIRFALWLDLEVGISFGWLGYALGLHLYWVTVAVDLIPNIEHYKVSVRLSESSPVSGKAFRPLARRAPSLHDGTAMDDVTPMRLGDF